MAAGAYSDFAILGLTYTEDDDEAQGNADNTSAHPVPSRSGRDQQQSIAAVSLTSSSPCICANEDFIIFSEFSEVQGPLPILTIPAYILDNHVFDIDSFILKIMSVDYQVNYSAGQFTLCEDVQMVQFSVTPNIHTYSHYFTLYDLKARGFVRPMCIAYVTRDEVKLKSNIKSLREEFLKVTDIVKFNNRKIFFNELATSIQDLRVKQEQYFESKREEVESNEDISTQFAPGSPGIQPLVTQYTELKHLQHIIEPTLENKYLEETLHSWETLAHISLQHKMQDYVAEVDRLNQSTSLKPVIGVSPWGCLAGLWALHVIAQKFSTCPLAVQLNKFWKTDDNDEKNKNFDYISDVKTALQNTEFLFLVRRLSCTNAQLGQSQDNTKLTNELEKIEEISAPASCDSFHSARDVDYLSSSSSGSIQGQIVEDENTENDLWTACIWSENELPSPQIPGVEIYKLFTSYPQAAHHVIYAMFSGRPVIVAGCPNHQQFVVSLVKSLRPLVPPDSSNTPPKILSWHQGIIVQTHLQKYRLIGLCVPERLSVLDLLSSKDKSNVMILEVAERRLHGPAYSGELLAPLQQSNCELFVKAGAETLMLLLKTVISEIYCKVNLARALNTVSPPGLHGSDLTIVKYLAEHLPPF